MLLHGIFSGSCFCRFPSFQCLFLSSIDMCHKNTYLIKLICYFSIKAQCMWHLCKNSLFNERLFSHYCSKRTMLVVQEVLGARNEVANEHKCRWCSNIWPGLLGLLFFFFCFLKSTSKVEIFLTVWIIPVPIIHSWMLIYLKWMLQTALSFGSCTVGKSWAYSA